MMAGAFIGLIVGCIAGVAIPGWIYGREIGLGIIGFGMIGGIVGAIGGAGAVAFFLDRERGTKQPRQ